MDDGITHIEFPYSDKYSYINIDYNGSIEDLIIDRALNTIEQLLYMRSMELQGIEHKYNII